jgi:hypothetical protein
VNEAIRIAVSSTLPTNTGRWRAAYWEPVMATGERLCFAVLTEIEGSRIAVRVLGDDRLEALFSGYGVRAAALLDRAVRMMNSALGDTPIDHVASPMSGVFLGASETAHVNDRESLLEIAKLMSSGLASLVEPDSADATEVEVVAGGPQRARQFSKRVRDLVLQSRSELATCFNKEATIRNSRRAVKFGFLSDQAVAHFGLLQATNLRTYVRTARGLFTELSLAKKSDIPVATLILGHPPLDSPELAVQERGAIEDYLQDLTSEALEFGVQLARAPSDEAARDALLAIV